MFRGSARPSGQVPTASPAHATLVVRSAPGTYLRRGPLRSSHPPLSRGWHRRLVTDEAEIRAAERRLAAALQSTDPEAWVYEYTDDAVFDGGGEHAVQGRDALLAMARAMGPLTEVSIRPLRTIVSGGMAAAWVNASWKSGEAADERTVEVRGILVWRRDEDGQWRVALEHIG